jgi:hypothetical protein
MRNKKMSYKKKQKKMRNMVNKTAMFNTPPGIAARLVSPFIY